jgi:prepilin-type N-terminal cleavage/methylation domain-containing protein
MTLLELLIVISIIGILSAIALPALKGMKQSNIMASANRQLLDDLALARQYAIKNRAEVRVAFAPPINPDTARPPEDSDALILGQLTSYRIFARRTVGDQPGNPIPRYLTGWRDLPDGVFIAPEKFPTTPKGQELVTLGTSAGPVQIKTFASTEQFKNQNLDFRFPYPSSISGFRTDLAYLTFDPQGRLLSDDATPDGRAIIPLARGGVLHERGANGELAWAAVDASMRPPGNHTNNYNFIVINALTGRARVERPEIQ